MVSGVSRGDRVNNFAAALAESVVVCGEQAGMMSLSVEDVIVVLYNSPRVFLITWKSEERDPTSSPALA